MAIKFVNNVDFVFYNTKGLAIENLATAPLTTVKGAMYYNTGNDTLYYRDATSWVPLTENTEGVSTITTTNDTYINLTPTTPTDGAVTVTAALSAVDGTATLATRFLSKDNLWAIPPVDGVSSFSNINGTYISAGTVNTLATGAVTVGVLDLSAIDGTATIASRFLTKDNTWSTAGYYISWILEGDSGVSQTIIDGETVDFAGGTGINTVVTTAGSDSILTINNTGVTSIIAGTNITVDQATGQVTIDSADEYVGTVTSVGSGAGLTGGPITTSGTILVDYISTDNVILAAADGTSTTLSGTDKILVSTGDAEYTNLSQIKTYIAGVTEVTSATTDQLTVANGTTTPALSIVTAAVINGGTGLATGDQIYDFVIGQGYQPGTVTSITVAAGTGLTSTGSPITVSGTITLALDVVGADNYILAQTGATAASTDTISFSDSTDSDTVKKSTFADIPMVALTAVKTYIDDAVANEGTFQGGYDAATNTPDLDSSPSASIQSGWLWAVTVAGDFFSEAVTPGDLIFANQDNPGATFGNWTVVQSGQDIATAAATDGASTKGIAGFDSAHFSATANGWIQANLADAAATGVARVAAGTGIDVSVASGVFTVSQETGSGRSKKVVLDSADAGVAVATAGTVRTWTLTVDNAAIFNTSALSADIMAECYLLSNGTTAYPEIVRSVSNTNELEFKFLMSPLPSDGDYVVLLHNVAGI